MTVFLNQNQFLFFAVLKMELHPSLFTASLSECVFEGSLGGDPGGHNVTVSRATLGYQSHSQHHVTLKGGGVVQWLCATKTPDVDSQCSTPFLLPRLFSYVTIVCLCSWSRCISVICRQC